MGICCAKCRTRADTRKYLRTRYNVERELSLEFENLMEEDPSEVSIPQYGAVLTDEEKKFITERKFEDLVRYQKKVDAELEAELQEQEENLRLEEESFIEAKRQAARVAKRLREQAERKTWMHNSQEMLNTEDDFEEFLNTVRNRSLNTKPGTSASELGGSSEEGPVWGSKTSQVSWSALFGLDDESEEEEFASSAPASVPAANSKTTTVLPTSSKTTAVIPKGNKNTSLLPTQNKTTSVLPTHSKTISVTEKIVPTHNKTASVPGTVMPTRNKTTTVLSTNKTTTVPASVIPSNSKTCSSPDECRSSAEGKISGSSSEAER